MVVIMCSRLYGPYSIATRTNNYPQKELEQLSKLVIDEILQSDPTIIENCNTLKISPDIVVLCIPLFRITIIKWNDICPKIYRVTHHPKISNIFNSYSIDSGFKNLYDQLIIELADFPISKSGSFIERLLIDITNIISYWFACLSYGIASIEYYKSKLQHCVLQRSGLDKLAHLVSKLPSTSIQMITDLQSLQDLLWISYEIIGNISLSGKPIRLSESRSSAFSVSNEIRSTNQVVYLTKIFYDCFNIFCILYFYHCIRKNI